MASLRQLIGLPFWEKVLLTRAVVVVITFRLCLRVLPFRRVVEFAERASQPGKGPVNDREFERAVIRSVTAIGRRTLGDTPCLTQALAAKYLLDKRGYETELKIGVTKEDDGNFKAHAWLQHDDRVLVGGRFSPHAYKSLPPLPVKKAVGR